MSKSDAENIQKREILDQRIERLIQTEEKISKKYKRKETHEGIITDVRTKKDIMELEVFLPSREEYRYVCYSLSNKKSIDRLLEEINSHINDISTIIGSEVVIYSREGTKRWYLLMTDKNVKYIKESKLFNLTESKYSKKVSIIYSGLISVVLFGLISIIFLQFLTQSLQLSIIIGIGLSSLYPVITSYILEFYYKLNSKLMYEESICN